MHPAPHLRGISARRFAIAALLALIAFVPGRALATGVSTALTPAVGFVALGAEFDVELTVTHADTTYNGFHAVMSYDPAALTFIPAPSLADQIGCLMDGTCSAACGNTFHLFQFAGDSLVVDLSLLCNQIQLSSTGQAYRLHFRAANTDQVTFVRSRRVSFYDGGLAISPGGTADARIIIGNPASVENGAGPTAWQVSARPNPAHGSVALSVSALADGEQSLDVLDLSGRLVRHLEGGWRTSGSRSLSWDGAGADGRRVATGVYLVRLRSGSHVATTRLTLLP